jgi:hypothetical protein
MSGIAIGVTAQIPVPFENRNDVTQSRMTPPRKNSALPLPLLSLGALLLTSITPLAAEPPSVFTIRQNDLYGLIDREGKVIVPVEFSRPLLLKDGLITASKGARTALLEENLVTSMIKSDGSLVPD